MSKKIKRYILFPAVLVIYTVIMSVMAYPRYQESDNLKEFFIILGISLAIAVLLYFVLKRQQKVREKFTQKN